MLNVLLVVVEIIVIQLEDKMFLKPLQKMYIYNIHLTQSLGLQNVWQGGYMHTSCIVLPGSS